MLLLVLSALPSTVLGTYLISSVHRGVIRISGKRYTRTRHPKPFWATIAFGVICTIGLLTPVWVALHVLLPAQVPALPGPHRSG
jgi:hypothetical protein